MKIVLTFLALIISTVLVAQNNPVSKQNTNSTTTVAASPTQKNANKKVHYVDKRTKPVQNNSNANSHSQNKKKPVVYKSENQGKAVLK